VLEKRRVLAFAGRVDVESVRIPELRLGDLRFEDVPAWIANLDFPDMKRRLRIDALIGLDVLKRTGLTIDYEARLLRFGPVGDNPNPVPFYTKLPFIPLTVRVNGEPLRLLLDTGAGELTLFAARVAGRVRIGRSDKFKEIRGAAGRTRLKKVRLDHVTVGEAEWSRVTGLVLEGPSPAAEMDGVLGPMALGVKRLHLDWEAGTVGFEP
jgi:predicted aspartyl protease